ncbi:MAG: MFS transporter [Deltaproteobacteria bacterium]|nr:MFS transporter [Deltaproteobacteria bacterium]
MLPPVWREFTRFQCGRFLTVAGTQMAHVAVGWQVYYSTRSKLALGYVGLAQFVPVAALSLVAGQVADRVDRRLVVASCHALVALAWASLGLSTLRDGLDLKVVWASMALLGLARAFQGPAAQALFPSLVPDHLFGRAVGLSSSLWQLATIVGPALGGLAYQRAASPSWIYFTASVMAALAAALTLGVHPRPMASARKAVTLHEVLAGVRYLRGAPVVLGAITLDLFAVLLGGAVALLPVFASDILHVGPRGLGALRSAPALGAAVTALALGWRPIERCAGRWMLGSVLVFGLATVLFGVSESAWLSLLALVVVGASDMVSVVVRQHAVQRATPDAMRGRVSAINLVFVGASNELGEFESGLTAEWWGPVGAAVFGGLGTCGVVLLAAVLFPSLRRLDRLEDLRKEEGASTT